MNHRDRLERIAIKTDDLSNWYQFRTVRNQVGKLTPPSRNQKTKQM